MNSTKPKTLNPITTKGKIPPQEESEVLQKQPSFLDKINNIIETMESKYTSNLTDRHVDEIQKLINEMKTNNYAFYYSELQSLAHLFTLQFQRILKGKKEFLPVIISLVELCNRPFLKEKTSDELNYVPFTEHLLNSFSEMLKTNLSQTEEMYTLFLSIINFINDFACTGIDDFKSQESDYKMKKLYGTNFSLLSTLKTEGTRNLRLISMSNILETLVYITTKNIYSEDCTIIMVHIMLNCALYKVNAEKLANLGALKDFVQIISNARDFRSLLVRCSIEAIWNVLENGGQDACRKMAYEEIVNALFYTFNNVIKNCFRLEDRNIRNDICILINYVVSSPESHNYFIYRDTTKNHIVDCYSSVGENYQNENNSGGIVSRTFLDTLLFYATYDEIKSIQKEKDNILNNVNTIGNETGVSMKNKTMLDPHEFFLTTSPDDIEFKKIIWTCILYIIKDNYQNPQVNEELEKYKFINCLLLYLDPEAMRFSCISRWQQPQLKDIQLLSLNILLNMVPLYQEYFERFKGYSTLIKFLQIYQDKERKTLCLKTINNIINSEVIKKELTEEKLIDFLLEIINSNENSLESREYAFNIISQMCIDNKLAQKEFRRKGGIEILQKNLNYQNVLDQIGNQKLFILVVLDCLWNAVIGNKRNEEQFIELDGLSTLFELLEQSDGFHIKIILSCIASLVDNKRSFSYFIQWKSKTNSNIDTTKLLINIYRGEDEKYGVKYEDGILDIKNDRPLNPNTSYFIRKQQKIEDAQNAKKRLRITKESNQDSFLGITKKSANNTNNKELDATHSSMSNTTANNTKFSSKEYLNQIYRSEDFVESYLNHKITEITKSFDLRETIFSIFYRIGFNNISINSNDDRQTFVSIKMYPIFKNLENWEDVVEEFQDTKFTPIGDDQNWIKTQIEESKEKMYTAVKQQKVISDNIKRAQQEELNEYFFKIKRMGELKKENERLKVHEKQEKVINK